MTSRLNLYGDRLVPTTGAHGADIASQRTDALDQACLDFTAELISQGCPVLAADIGAGSGVQSRKLAAIGATILMVDLTDQSAAIDAFNAELGREAILFARQDVRTLPDALWPQPLDLFYAQRMINYLPYADAFALLRRAAGFARAGARFFVSSGGLNTEYGQNYPHRDRPPAERFAPLSPDMAEKHGIHAPQCLYTTDELAMMLQEAGLEILQAEASAFGNPKVIAVRR